MIDNESAEFGFCLQSSDAIGARDEYGGEDCDGQIPQGSIGPGTNEDAESLKDSPVKGVDGQADDYGEEADEFNDDYG